MERYVAYYRVSTAKQERSGLGLAAQREIVEKFAAAHGELINGFVEIESGRNNSREILWQAIREAKALGATLLIARLDRFSRRVSFIASVMEQGIRLTVAEMPHATEFQLHIFAALAQEERRLISERTKAALAQAKKRGVVLGRNGRMLAAKRKQEAAEYVLSLREFVPDWDYLSYSEIARRLNDRGILSREGGRFHPQTIRNYDPRSYKKPSPSPH